MVVVSVAAVFVLQAAVAPNAQLAVPPASEQEPEPGAQQVVVAQDAQLVRSGALVAHSAESPADRRGDPQAGSVVAACWVESPGDPQDDCLAVRSVDDHC